MKINDQGMVVVRVTKAFEMWFPGMLCGFFPSKAKDLVAQGFAAWPDEPEAAEPAAVAEAEDGGEVISIPADWRDLHHTKIISLARKVAGEEAPVSITKDAAIAIIEARIAADSDADKKDS